MKKSIVLGLIGFAATVATSFGQGGVFFANYEGGPIGSPISYGNSLVPAGKAGQAVGSTFSAQLWYLNGATWTALPATTTAFFGVDGDVGTGAGYFNFGAAVIPLPVGQVQCQVYAFNNAQVGSYAPGEIFGFSNPFTITTVSTQDPNYPTFAGTTYAGFTVSAVPEPSTAALLGIGCMSLLALRRRN